MAARADRITPYLHALRDKGIPVNRVIADTAGWATVARFACGGKDAVLVTIGGGRFEVGRLREGLLRSPVAGTFRSELRRRGWRNFLPEIESRIEEARNEGGTPTVIVGAATRPIWVFRTASRRLLHSCETRTSRSSYPPGESRLPLPPSAPCLPLSCRIPLP